MRRLGGGPAACPSWLTSFLGTDRLQRALFTASASPQSVQIAAPLGPDRLVADVLPAAARVRCPRG